MLSRGENHKQANLSRLASQYVADASQPILAEFHQQASHQLSEPAKKGPHKSN